MGYTIVPTSPSSLSKANLNTYVRDNLLWLRTRPMFKVYKGEPQSLDSGAANAELLNIDERFNGRARSEVFDTRDMMTQIKMALGWQYVEPELGHDAYWSVGATVVMDEGDGYRRLQLMQVDTSPYTEVAFGFVKTRADENIPDKVDADDNVIERFMPVRLDAIGMYEIRQGDAMSVQVATGGGAPDGVQTYSFVDDETIAVASSLWGICWAPTGATTVAYAVADWTGDTFPTAWTDYANAMNRTIRRPLARIRQEFDQAFTGTSGTGTTWVDLDMGTIVDNNADMASAADPTKLTIQHDGYYLVTAGVAVDDFESEDGVAPGKTFNMRVVVGNSKKRTYVAGTTKSVDTGSGDVGVTCADIVYLREGENLYLQGTTSHAATVKGNTTTSLSAVLLAGAIEGDIPLFGVGGLTGLAPIDWTGLSADYIPAGALGAATEMLDYLWSPPVMQVNRKTPLEVPNDRWTPVPFERWVHDNHVFVEDPFTEPGTNIRVPHDGVYVICASASFPGAGVGDVGFRGVRVVAGGETVGEHVVPAGSPPSPTWPTELNKTWLHYLRSGDTVSMELLQTSGEVAAARPVGHTRTRLSFAWVGDLEANENSSSDETLEATGAVDPYYDLYQAEVVETAPVFGPNPGTLFPRTGVAYSYQVVVTDDDLLTYSATGLPAGLTISSSTGLISGTPTTAGATVATVTADDGTEDTDEDYTFNVVANQAPVVDAVADQTGEIGDTVSLQITATDPDGDPITYGAAGLPAGLSINSASGLIQGTLTAAVNASVQLTAADGYGAPGTESFTWTVTGETGYVPSVAFVVQDDASLSSWETGAKAELEGLGWTLTAVDRDTVADNLTYDFIVNSHTISTFTGDYTTNDATSSGDLPVLSFTPQSSHVAASAARQSPGYFGNDMNTPATPGVVAWPDETNNTTVEFRTTGHNIQGWDPSDMLSGASVIALCDPAGNGGASSGDVSGFALPLGTTGPGGTTTAKVVNLSGGWGFQHDWTDAGLALIARAATWLLGTTVVGDGTATAGGGGNSAPVVTNPGNQTNAVSDVVSLTISATDPDTDTMTYSASALPTGLTINSSSGAITGTVSASANETNATTVTVTDGTDPTQVAFTWTITGGAPPTVPLDEWRFLPIGAGGLYIDIETAGS